MSKISVLGLGAMGLARHIDGAQAAHGALASPEGRAGAADVPNYYHDDPLFMFFEK
jgi:hypothetical protein